MKRGLFAAAVASTAIVFASPAVQAFPEKDITFVIPYSAGGGFDRTVRLIAPFMEKYLPNNVNVVPKNVPGAGGRKGIAQVYRAKPDGHTIAVFNMPGMAIPALTGEKVAYDLDKVSWVGRLATAVYMMGVGKKSGITSVSDLKKLGRKVKFTTTAYGSTGYTASAVAAQVMQLPFEMLTGYKGSKNYTLGAIRGDGDAFMGVVSSTVKYVQSGDVVGVATFEKVSSIPGVPTVRSLGFPELEGLGLQRLVGGPPGIPADRIKILEDAMLKAMADPELKEKSKKRPFAPLGAAESASEVGKMLSFYTKYKDALKRQ